MRITPENLTELTRRQVVLIGTNESGMHGAGIARYAEENWGAIHGQGFGPMGQCFGLPTKNWVIDTLPLTVIENYVDRYIAWTRLKLFEDHIVTKIGCGLAGYTIDDIAPLFKICQKYPNIWLPQDFHNFYEGKYIKQTKLFIDGSHHRTKN